MLKLITAVKVVSWCLAALSSLDQCFHGLVSDLSTDLHNSPLTGFLSAFSNPNFFFVRII
ncbi:hypothetical protein AXX17_AT5G54760 [Arabidopsis thaliana]|uniref:Transmembrane protein n=1 Tax=Arabidopsis thaliana TaxID=3702 RepID=A0A178US86_ARATH|nr:hypothetical protein AXX17_AT5G54760 [Arabidopsis thaliana]